MAIPRTRKQVMAHPAVAHCDYEPSEDVKWWIYLKDGFSAASDPGARNGRTLREAIDDVFPVVPCDCCTQCRAANARA